jgi:protein TonB
MRRKLYITFIILFLSTFVFGQIDSLGLKKCISSPDKFKGQPVYITVDKMPEYKGGMTELMRLIAKKITFTDREPNRNSIIHTTFVIDTLGQIQNICTITNRTVLDEQETQITDVLKNAPNWTPGILNDRKVCVRVTIPVRLCLK